MVKKIVANIRKGIKNASEIGYHIIVLCLSAGIAMSISYDWSDSPDKLSRNLSCYTGPL